MGANVEWDRKSSTITVTSQPFEENSDSVVSEPAEQPKESLSQLSPRKIDMTASFTPEQKFKHEHGFKISTAGSIIGKESRSYSF